MPRPRGKEGMAQCISRLDPLVWVECKTVVEKINKVVKILRLSIVHPSRRSREPCPQVPRWLHHSHGSNGGL